MPRIVLWSYSGSFVSFIQRAKSVGWSKICQKSIKMPKLLTAQKVTDYETKQLKE
jgi:hypothetical protein